jgi:hypothetical protein
MMLKMVNVPSVYQGRCVRQMPMRSSVNLDAEDADMCTLNGFQCYLAFMIDNQEEIMLSIVQSKEHTYHSLIVHLIYSYLLSFNFFIQNSWSYQNFCILKVKLCFPIK